MTNPVAEALTPFFWGRGGARMTPEQIAREREIAEALGVVDTSPVGHWLEGAARMANAAVGRIREGRANRAADENATFNRETVAGLLGGLGGVSTASMSPVAAALTGSTPVDPASARVAQAHGDDAIRSGIIDTASALGIDPLDLATAISYETAGTFDPTKAGPTTQWGQHRGLIQFGEPQAQEHGVNWNDPVASQLGPDGAVASYLRSTGVKPGMGLLDIYSAINAGGVGRHNASDANNGGAPGSVRDKVEQQMAGHRQKAMALLGMGEGQPAIAAVNDLAGSVPSQAVASSLTGSPVNADLPMMGGGAPMPSATPAQAGGINPAIIEALSSPYADEGTRRIAGILLGQHLEQQQQANDPMRALQLEKGRLEIEALRNPRVDPTDTMRNLEWRAQQAGLQPGTPEYNQFMITGGRNDGITVNNMGNIPAGYQLTTDPQTGAQRMEPIPGSPAAMELAEAERMRGEREGQGQRYGRIVLEDIGRVLEAVESNPNLVAGPLGSMLSNLPGTGAHDVSSMLNTIRANVGFDRLQAMRAASPTGGALGAVSDSENRMLQSTLGALEQSQSPQQFAQNLRRLQNLYTEIVHGPAPTGVSDDEWSRRAWGVQSQDGGNRPLSEMSDEELEAIVNGNR